MRKKKKKTSYVSRSRKKWTEFSSNCKRKNETITLKGNSPALENKNIKVQNKKKTFNATQPSLQETTAFIQKKSI